MTCANRHSRLELAMPSNSSAMFLRFTPLMKKRLTRRAQAMIGRSLTYFPELQGKSITIGYTRAHLGTAILSYQRESEPRLIIRLKVRKLTYQTIGHELTHLVQGLGRGHGNTGSPFGWESIPSGEKQCDIWTLARDPLFCDDAPTYLRLPRVMREQWPDYAEEVRKLCITAIKKRENFRLYIRWLEGEIRKLARGSRREQSAPEQLFLPFPDWE
jgi:hypothetical protein